MSPDPSKPVPLDDAVVKVAAKAALETERKPAEPSAAFLKAMEVAILAADEARGMRVEREAEYKKGKLRLPPTSNEPEEPGWEKAAEWYRYVSRWFPIKGPVDE